MGFQRKGEGFLDKPGIAVLKDRFCLSQEPAVAAMISLFSSTESITAVVTKGFFL